MTEDTKPANPGVRFPPPFFFIAGLLLAWLFERRIHGLPLALQAGSLSTLRDVGYLLVLIGVGIAAWGMVTFSRAHTAIIPMKPASSLVETGPYRFTRNPMYTGITVQYLGGAFLLNSGWAMIFLPVVLLLLYRFVIRREENYLSAEFGEAYTSYRSRVKRWM